ncbi:hypothetical protein FNH22_09675 [Fulvivirga sp. M361]|nr:hypothetical protein FNH22_09675 [Fulvivirga sp. M361]
MQPLYLLITLSVTIGLAPFFPEPHIIGKIKWLAGGGVGMELTDYLDLLFHGVPWVLLLAYSGFKLKQAIIKKQ